MFPECSDTVDLSWSPAASIVCVEWNPGFEDRLNDPPGRLNSLEASEQRVITLEGVAEQTLARLHFVDRRLDFHQIAELQCQTLEDRRIDVTVRGYALVLTGAKLVVGPGLPAPNRSPERPSGRAGPWRREPGRSA